MPAPASGNYEELNVLGAPTGHVVAVDEGELLPGLLRGYTWRRVARRQGIAEMGPAELKAKAAEFLQMANTATTAETRDALLRIARRYARLVGDRDGR